MVVIVLFPVQEVKKTLLGMKAVCPGLKLISCALPVCARASVRAKNVSALNGGLKRLDLIKSCQRLGKK